MTEHRGRRPGCESPRGDDVGRLAARSAAGKPLESYADDAANRISAALRVVAAAERWRDRIARSVLGTHEQPLANAVDEWRASRSERT